MALGEVLFTADQIAERVAQLAAEIRRDLAGRPLTIVGILRGSIFFLTDLVRQLDLDATIELVEAASYGGGTRSPGQVALRRYGRLEVAGRHVLIVDDIADTGNTLAAVRRAVEAMGPASVRVCVLLDKPSRRQVPVAVDYRGFAIDDLFVVGYGLDYAGRYRNLPYIARWQECPPGCGCL